MILEKRQRFLFRAGKRQDPLVSSLGVAAGEVGPYRLQILRYWRRSLDRTLGSYGLNFVSVIACRLQYETFLLAGQFPKSHGAVPSTGGQGFAIRRKAHHPDLTRMTKRGNFTTAGNFPNLRFVIARLRQIASHCHYFSVSQSAAG